MPNTKKSMLDAFIEQTYGSKENAAKADKAADIYAANDNQMVSLTDISIAAGHAFGDTNIRNRVSIPSQNPILQNDNSGYSSAFKNYDYSLDKPRIRIKNGTNVDCGDGGSGDVEWGEAHDPSIGNWEIGK